MENEIKKLKNGEVYYTEAGAGKYHVISGEILVYIAPVKNGRKRRRMYIGRLAEGSLIPGLYDEASDGTTWRFAFVALDEAAFRADPEPADEKEIVDFCEEKEIYAADLEGAGEYLDFVYAVSEHYEKNELKEDGYIYATANERIRTRNRLTGIIKNAFGESQLEIRRSRLRETGYSLYDAMNYLCITQDMEIAPVEKVISCCGRRFLAKDIARVSHFAVRDIVLEDKWFKRDCGAFLAFMADGGRPVACIPNGPYSYYMYDPENGEVKRITANVAGQLRRDACMIYPPFPQKAMKIPDIISFGMKYVNRSDITRLLVLAFVGTLTGLLIPFMNEQAYDKFIPMGNAYQMKQLGAILLACTLGNVSFTIVKNLATFRSMNSMKYAVQSATFDRLFNLPESFYREYESADLGQRVMGVSNIYAILTNSVVTTVFSTLFSLMYLWRMNKYSKEMTKPAVIMTLSVSLIIIVISRFHLHYEEKKISSDLKAQSGLFQYIAGISKIRISATEDRALLNYLEDIVTSQNYNEKEGKLSAVMTTITQSMNIVFSMFMYYTLIHEKIQMSVGVFSAFMAAFGAFSNAMMTFAGLFFTLNQIVPIYKNAKPVLEALPENTESSHAPGELKGEVEINNVSFSYSEEGEPVIKNFKLHIDPGEYVAIVGASGCGKSTLLKLMLGFEKAGTGKIYFDNHDIDDLDKRELRKKFGVVLQEGGIISGSIRDNITITSPYVKNERIEETIREVGLEEDIKEMPMGIFTVISEGAGTISGGQRQRILIARAIVGKPKIIFLDEATSALDNKTQEQVVKTLEKLDATKVVIAHRLSTVRNCDRIIVMDDGRIVEQGNYDELMEKKGLFYELAKRQIS
ncbi:MAG: NHLP bacteriocin export ABC transporter permease/ATPase subunit [Lachnospiraceae bacterium]|nr:NHLP bacteriocin export ABC transporter permease/ATPase subunit [Lachnospiraceae bacterium]